ncbi:MAG TPA: hypothetical protein VFZ08_09540 [Terriglobia bacterium]|nr:hypothetical protein [Terriglobia bacterium]
MQFSAVFTIVASVIAAWWSYWTHRQNTRLERAKWIKDLYEKFYERNDLKAVRDLVDSGDRAKIAELVGKEESHFTDYLNFFEFLGYLEESKQVQRKDILGIFHYYLASLKGDKEISRYVNDTKNGFEMLRKLLNKVKVKE